MKVIGIDPGSHITGYGVVEKTGAKLVCIASGAIKTDPALPLESRLCAIFTGINEVISAYAPETAAIETVFCAKNVKSAVQLSHARGVALLASSLASLGVHEYSPRSVKLATVGYGNASKEQVRMMVSRILNTPEPRIQDAADALAVAVCHLHTWRPGAAHPERHIVRDSPLKHGER
ncbi:MAG: crossover junction endodeoxyribonuclease RuvC [Deltaproteobacteria bacterium]